MELGKIQTAWVEALEKYPERQHSGSLAVKHIDSITCCCLGQAKLTLCEMIGDSPEFDVNGLLNDGKGEITSLANSYDKLGLHDRSGGFYDSFCNNVKVGLHRSLMSMNDGFYADKKTWPEIAKFIRENPDLVFNKSV